jgi:hypothetical protein
VRGGGIGEGVCHRVQLPVEVGIGAEVARWQNASLAVMPLYAVGTEATMETPLLLRRV